MRLLLLITVFIVGLMSQTLETETVLKTEHPILVGLGKRLDIEKEPYGEWFSEEYETYEMEFDLIEAAGDFLEGIGIETFMGTWCEDSRREVPRFYKILDELSWDDTAMRLIMLDRSKKSGLNIEKGKNIHHVPTFIFLKGGEEIGRIVESPIESLEDDLFNILIGSPSVPNYNDWKPEDEN